MKKKFICAVCGYIYEGDAAPEKCPICKAPASKFSELKEDGETTYATVHRIGDGKPEGVSEEMIQDLRNHFNGECGEVGMYLAMVVRLTARVIPRLPRLSSAMHLRRQTMLLVSQNCWVSAYGIPRPIWRSVLLPRLVLAKTSSVSLRTQRLPASTLSTIPFMRWQRMRLVMVLASQDC